MLYLSIASSAVVVMFLGLYLFRVAYGVPPAGRGACNRRREPRVPMRLEMELHAPGAEPLRGATRDLSLGGAFLAADARLPEGTDCAVMLLLEGGRRPIRLALKGRVARHAEGGMGIAFIAMDAQCYENLAYLVAFSMAQADRVIAPAGARRAA